MIDVIGMTFCTTSRMLFCQFPERKDQAIELYRKGIDELEKGLAVEITGQGKFSLIIFIVTAVHVV